ncbi:hypothetical protein CSC12_5226 [Klebsiella michiganensis]|nr:hypothetical protein CSC12_5226 [Klebsiella michiganensis]
MSGKKRINAIWFRTLLKYALSIIFKHPLSFYVNYFSNICD